MTILKKISIVGPLAPPAGGMANLTLKLSELIAKEGLEVNVIQTNAPYGPRWIGKIIGIRAIFRLVPYFWDLIQNTKKSDVIHIMANSGWSWHLFSVPAIVVGRLYGKPVVVNYHGGDAERFFAKSWKWVNKALKNAHCVIVPSKFLQRIFSAYGQNTVVIPNVLDTKIPQNKERDFNAQKLHLIVTRNLEKIYGIDIIINAFSLIIKKYPLSTLSIAGSGPEHNALMKKVNELGLDNQVTFTGRLNATEIASLYEDADILLNASTVDNAPSSLLEGLAYGIPVVSSNAGGISDMLKHEYDALLVEINEGVSISEEVFRLIENEEIRNALVENGLKTVQNFQWPIVWKQLLSCYELAQKKMEQ